MNHLTNLYKHKCEQLQEQINNIKRMLNEAEAPPVNDPDYPQPKQLPDGRWYTPIPSDFDPQIPNPTGPWQYPVWNHDSEPPKGWDGWWPDAPEDDPRRLPPTEWPRTTPIVIPANRPRWRVLPPERPTWA